MRLSENDDQDIFIPNSDDAIENVSFKHHDSDTTELESDFILW